MPADSAKPRHRYSLEELLGEPPPGWEPRPPPKWELRQQHFYSRRQRINAHEAYAVQSDPGIWKVTIPLGLWLKRDSNFATSYAAMADFDDWLDLQSPTHSSSFEVWLDDPKG